MQFHLFLPQMRLTIAQLVERARAAESAGFEGIALMDHLAPPAALDQPMFEAMTTATWLAAATDTLHVGHLVLCDAMRHPAVLARQAVTLDHASGGRFELGLGWGSVPSELETFGVASTDPRARVDRMSETLDLVRALWSGETVDFEGQYHRVVGGRQLPTPLGRVPIVIGGAGPRTMQLVAKHADWWNLPIHKIEQLEELRARAGSARVSIQLMVTLIRTEAERDDVVAAAKRRFGFMPTTGRAIGNAEELAAIFESYAARGVERIYAWFTDFAQPDTLIAFGQQFINH
jgi:alkanesulfonate monooxygenase SsuD/methylene tetrahydromethanopterin reductase-like flavin-dependent oxidoreductase (luciferase family)